MHFFRIILPLILGLFTSISSLFCQPVEYNWVKTFSGCKYAHALSQDHEGSLIMTGQLNDTLELSNGSVFYPDGESEMLIKLDVDGNVTWARQWFADFHYLNSLATWEDNIYYWGKFEDTLFIGMDTIVSSGSYTNIFMKLDPDGNLVDHMASPAGPSPVNYPICTDHEGNVVLAGSLGLGDVSAGDPSMKQKGTFRIHKLDPDLNLLFSIELYSIYGVNINDIAVDGEGHIIITGLYAKDLAIGDTLFETQSWGNIFLAAYDADGNFIFARSAGGPNSDSGEKVATDSAGNIYCSGTLHEPWAVFGDTTLTLPNIHNMFISKYSSSGDLIWIGTGSVTDEHDIIGINGVAIDSQENLYVSGTFAQLFSIGDTSIAAARTSSKSRGSGSATPLPGL